MKFKSADEKNYKISYDKKKNELELLSIIKSNAIDCNLNKYGNYFKFIKQNKLKKLINWMIKVSALFIQD